MLYPRWRLVERGADLVRLPSAHIFAHEQLGIAPPDPWMMNSGLPTPSAWTAKPASTTSSPAASQPEQMRDRRLGQPGSDVRSARSSARVHLDTLRSELKLSGASRSC